MSKSKAPKKQRARQKEPAAQIFDDESAMFSGLLIHALAVSEGIGRHIAEPRKGYATWLYMRACVMARSLESLFTPVPPAHGHTYLDHASIASLARALIETITVQLYIGDASISEAEWHTRKHVIDLHDFRNRRSFLSLLDLDDKKGDSDFAYVVDRVKTDPLFLNLSAERQKRILDGDDMFTVGRHNAMLKLGWGDRTTRGIYKYFSVQAHSQSMAFHRTLDNDMYAPNSLGSKMVAGLPIQFARKALGVSCLHILSLFPRTELAIDRTVLTALKSEYP
jgi:hypothetical protein